MWKQKQNNNRYCMFYIIFTVLFHWYSSHFDVAMWLKRSLKKFRIWVEKLCLGLHTLNINPLKIYSIFTLQ